jgi:UDP-glucuronate 4-epimerase
MRILVTGAAGLIGAPTTKLLISKGYEVIGVDNFSDYYSPDMKKRRIKEMGIEENITNLDITDSYKLFSVFKENLPSAVIHLAARPGVRAELSAWNEYNYSNIIGFQNVVAATEKFSVEKFLYASSSSVYGRNAPIPFLESEIGEEVSSYYASTKRQNEFVANFLPDKGISTIGLRFFTVYGPWGRPDMALLRFITAGLSNLEIPLTGDLETLRDFTHIEDVVRIISELLTDTRYYKNEVFNLAASNPQSLQTVLALLKEFGLSSRYKQLGVSKLDAKITFGSSNKLAEFGIKPPALDIRSGLAQTLDWARNQDLDELKKWVYPENLSA